MKFDPRPMRLLAEVVSPITFKLEAEDEYAKPSALARANQPARVSETELERVTGEMPVIGDAARRSLMSPTVADWGDGVRPFVRTRDVDKFCGKVSEPRLSVLDKTDMEEDLAHIVTLVCLPLDDATFASVAGGVF